uniref:UvrD-helicase domain-containing protein n=1 Tax=Haemonchus placei TaxID=6290 RepID=A0A0N4X0G5_HAEPC
LVSRVAEDTNSMSSSRTSTEEVDNGCVAAESTNILSEVSTEEVSAMDTSEPVSETQGSSSQHKDTVSSQNPEPPVLQVRWGAPVSLESRSRRSPTPSSQSSSSTVEQPTRKAKPQQTRKSSLANMTASLEQLAVAHLSPPHPMEVEEEGDHSPTPPPPKLRRSGSSRRQPEAWSFRVNQRTLTLTPDQRDAFRVGASRIPLVAIQAAFGTSKTLFTETLLSLEDFPDM